MRCLCAACGVLHTLRITIGDADSFLEACCGLPENMCLPLLQLGRSPAACAFDSQCVFHWGISVLCRVRRVSSSRVWRTFTLD